MHVVRGTSVMCLLVWKFGLSGILSSRGWLSSYGLHPCEPHAQAMPAQGGQTPDVTEPPGQLHQDRWAISPRPAPGVSARCGSSTAICIPASDGACTWTPSSTSVTRIHRVIGGDERQPRGRCVSEGIGSQRERGEGCLRCQAVTKSRMVL